MLKLGGRSMNWKEEEAATINTNPNSKFSISQNSVYPKNDTNIPAQYGHSYNMNLEKSDHEADKALDNKNDSLNVSPTSQHEKFEDNSVLPSPNTTAAPIVHQTEDSGSHSSVGSSVSSSFPPYASQSNHRPSLPHYTSVPQLQQIHQFQAPAANPIPAIHSYAPQPNYYPVPIPGFIYAPNHQIQQLPSLPPLGQSNLYYPEYAGNESEIQMANSLQTSSPPKQHRKSSASSTSNSSDHASPKRAHSDSISSKSSKSAIKRSRMGCITCRQRKKRCCETKPKCTECSRLRLNCVWPVPGTEHKNKSKELKEEENVIHHEIYGKIKVLRGIVEYKSDE